MPLLIILYMYFANNKVDIIILFNYLEFFVLYNILKKKLWDITSISKYLIK